MYALPAFGGYLADRVIGRRRAVAIGASIMLVGQVLMVIAAIGAAHGACGICDAPQAGLSDSMRRSPV